LSSVRQAGDVRSTGRGIVSALGAAVLFGASAPLIKKLLVHGDVLALSSLLYLGAALALTVGAIARQGRSPEAALSRHDLPLVGAVALTGGIVGPALLLFGLERVSGSGGSLLLNLEGPFTLLLAVVLFGEHASRRVILAAALVFVGALVVQRDPGPSSAAPLGYLAVAGACLAWAVDNNLTQRLALRDPLQVVQVKALAAGLGSGALALLLSSRFPTAGYAVAVLAVGGTCYGSSILLDVWALRLLGAARESALFALAPFVGAALAIPLLGEHLRPAVVVAGLLMAGGVALLVREDHEHQHVHLPIEHDHVHTHDEHHQHAHPGGDTAEHSHLHRHLPVRHGHPHVSDAHHRHDH
jgi:drug/metabolite transporter (DMT)-like permease